MTLRPGGYSVITQIPDKDSASFSRAECFRYLNLSACDLPRLRILQRQRNTPIEPTDVALTDGGQSFQAHKDVLSFWSDWLRREFEGARRDHNQVTWILSRFKRGARSLSLHTQGCTNASRIVNRGSRSR
ncbi:hypothetical protein BJY01DRAFT_215995 [Aspergillus pseudoustus]|uniref:BTB domain-containing protein n=1 Tax=Aspergillus pseudoustus TaxID=1810923 RepID=A0ABR4JT39_9EURO